MARLNNPTVLAVLLLAIAAAIVGVVYTVPRGDNGSHPSDGGSTDPKTNDEPAPDPFDPRNGAFGKSLDAVCEFLTLVKKENTSGTDTTKTFVSTKFGSDATKFDELVNEQEPKFIELRKKYVKLTTGGSPATLKTLEEKDFADSLAAFPGHIVTISKVFDELNGEGIWPKAVESAVTANSGEQQSEDTDISKTYKEMREKMVELFDFVVKHCNIILTNPKPTDSNPPTDTTLKQALDWVVTFSEDKKESSNFGPWLTNFEAWIVPHLLDTTEGKENQATFKLFKDMISRPVVPAASIAIGQASATGSGKQLQATGSQGEASVTSVQVSASASPDSGLQTSSTTDVTQPLTTETAKTKVHEHLVNTFEQIKGVLDALNAVVDQNHTVVDAKIAKWNPLAPAAFDVLMKSLEEINKLTPKRYLRKPASSTDNSNGSANATPGGLNHEDEAAVQLIAYLSKTLGFTGDSKNIYYRKASAAKQFRHKALILLDRLRVIQPVLVLYRKERLD
ncbi:hypothetical protein BdWA1_003480 [Babesia duncani]|uniref:Uncharacterized protein n=1 Tax=Babesia duncani TaxID=323732 RepID=A0AAD9PIT4_9APIC|nr:hypothetical protein BdWA1_003480 [Babesia duncani]